MNINGLVGAGIPYLNMMKKAMPKGRTEEKESQEPQADRD